MDYAFVPGSSPPERNLKTFFRRQPNTVLVDNPLYTRVDQFIDHLKDLPNSARPIGNIIIVSHGNDGGFMSITFGLIILSLGAGFEQHTTYEVLEDADNSNINNLDAPPNPPITLSLIDANTKIFIKGCKIGQAQPFVEKFKACFGGTVPVSAPKHFDAVISYRDVGLIENLSYDFSFPTLQAFRGPTARTQLIAAFQAKNFKFLDGTNVPNTSWTTWLPRNVSLGRRTISYRVNFSPPLKDSNGDDILTLRLNTRQGFRAETQRYTFTKGYSSQAPTDRAQQEADLRTSLQTQPRFSTTHPYPMWERYELDNFNAFIDGFRWAFSRSSDHKNLICTGTRVLYTLVIPITTDPLAGNNLILNIAPEPGNTSPTTPQILETNTDLFLTV